MQAGKPKYYLIKADALPEVFVKVTEAKALLETALPVRSPRRSRPLTSAAAHFTSTRMRSLRSVT